MYYTQNKKARPVRSQSSMMTATSNGGFATLEILIAFAVLILSIGAVILLSFGNQSIAVDSETNNEALYKAQKMLEDARADSRFDFALVNPIPDTQDNIYTKSLAVSMPDLFTKNVTSDITWSVGGGRNQTITLSTLLTNPDAVDGGDTCNSDISSFDWENPKIITYKNGVHCENGKDESNHNCEDGYEFGKDILNDTSSGFPVTSIQTFNKKMYVTVNNAHGNNDDTFFILDISATPQLKPEYVLGKLDNSPEDQGDISEGLNAVAVDGGNYAYVANAYDSSSADCEEGDNCAQLQVIKTNCVDNNSDGVDDICNPVIVRNFKISSFTGYDPNTLASGKSIFYREGIVYLGLAMSDNNEFYTMDVNDPDNPQILDSYEIGNGVNSILIKDGYAYIASPNNQELKILDVSNPSDIKPAGSFNSPEGAGHGKSLSLVGNKLYLGKTDGAGFDFHILDNTNPDNILSELGGFDPHSSINGILVRDYLAFLITNGEFQTWRIDNPSNITQYVNPHLTLPPGSGNVQGSATDCEGNYIYVSSQKSVDVYIPECSDGVDNDKDGKIDMDDPQCKDSEDDNEDNKGGGGNGSHSSQDKGYISIITAHPK